MPAARLARWLDGFATRHGCPTYAVAPGAADVVRLTGSDGSTAALAVPFPPLCADPTAPYAGLVDHVLRPRTLGLVLLRRGGYAVGLSRAGTITDAKAGTRHVQGRTAAGGWSQHRYARRRANQTAELVAAVAEQTARLLLPVAGTLDAVVTGGDRRLLATLLGEARLAPLRALVLARVLDVADPRARTLARAVEQAGASVIELAD